MKFGEKKILSGTTLVILIITGIFSPIFFGVPVSAIVFPDVYPGEENFHEETVVLGEGGASAAVANHPYPLVSPVPEVDYSKTTDFIEDEEQILLYWAANYHCPPGFLIFAFFKTAYFWWKLSDEGEHTAYVDFKCLMRFKYTSGYPEYSAWTDYEAGRARVTITIEGEGEDESGSGTCFLKDTKILMGDLSVKNIDEIEVNDTVKSMNMVTGEIGNATVFELQQHEEDEMTNGYLEITIENKFKFGVTPDHPIPVMEDDFEELLESSDPNITTDDTEFAFIRAGDLEIGDSVFFGNVTNITEYPEAQVDSYSLFLENNLTFIVACTPLNQQQYEPPSGQFAQELDDWKDLTLTMHQKTAPKYYPTIAPAVKGTSASNIYLEGLNEYFEGVSPYALPMLQPVEE